MILNAMMIVSQNKAPEGVYALKIGYDGSGPDQIVGFTSAIGDLTPREFETPRESEYGEVVSLYLNKGFTVSFVYLNTKQAIVSVSSIKITFLKEDVTVILERTKSYTIYKYQLTSNDWKISDMFMNNVGKTLKISILPI